MIDCYSYIMEKSNTDVISVLNTLGNTVLSRYPNINYGGCCVYAAIVAAALEKKGIPVVGIVSSHFSDNNINEAREHVRHNTVPEWERNGIFFTHVGIEFKIGKKKMHYDTHGVRVAKSEFHTIPIYPGRLTKDELRALGSRKSGWNSTFDRTDIPQLRKLVKTSLAVINPLPLDLKRG